MTKFNIRASSSDSAVTRSSDGLGVTFNEVKYISLKASEIFSGSVMCSSVTLIATGALEEGLNGTVCFVSFQRFLVLCCFVF